MTMTEWTVRDADGAETTITDAEWAWSWIDGALPPPFDEGVADDFEWHLGVGFHVGEWDIDAVLSHETPFRMGYWLTGYQPAEDEPPVGRVSATYRF